MVYLSDVGLPVLLWKKAVKRVCVAAAAAKFIYTLWIWCR